LRRVVRHARLAASLAALAGRIVGCHLACAQPAAAPAPAMHAPLREVSLQNASRDVSLAAVSGVVGDGKTDDMKAINALLAELKQGGRVRLPPDRQYLIDSGDLIIPPGVRLAGSSSPMGGAEPGHRTRPGGFILNPAYTIRMGVGSQLDNLAVVAKGLLPDPSATQAIAAVAQWAGEKSVGITLPRNAGGQTIQNVFVEGFNTCIKASVGRFSIQRVTGDCYNGLEVTAGGDNYYVDDVRFEPFYGLQLPAVSGAWARPGIAFNLHDGNTGSILTRVFSFMWANGLVFNNTGVAQVANSGFEWRPEFGNGVTGAVGVRWINHNAETSTDNLYINGFDTAFSDEGWGEVLIRAGSVGSARVAAFNLGGGGPRAAAVAFAGRPAAGAAVELTLQTAAVRNGAPLTIRVGAAAGDTDATLAMDLAQRIDAAQPLIAAGLFAGVKDGIVTVYGPPGVAMEVGARASGGVAASVEAAKGGPGSYGAVIAANVTSTPAFVVGAGITHWNIVAPYLGNGNLQRNWLVADPAAMTRVSLSGIPWSRIHGIGNLSACGRDPKLVPGASDVRGSLIEGIGATGCVLAFATPYVVPPTCVVSSPNGAAIAGYGASRTELRISNPERAGAQIAYVCAP